ncbi:MAG: hypothetical protein COB67_01045 [SAR324 cluster bacterium]|uniref:CN hydrolase domain-containing protein n=1 Tax=SAR324 cluster bacterium TaxID=2024889 RepID=A0A2A4TB62_9DELT|nr:MAG: hypothetical protein COB67_01045 [SAR324 cluster bacterium]
MVCTATIQFKPVKGDPEENLRKVLDLCGQAITAGAKLLTLPEMCLTGYIWPNASSIRRYAEPALGVSYLQLAEFCRNNQCYLAYGFAETCSGHLYNAQNLIGPGGGLLATYRKTHLFDADCTWATPGNSGFISVNTEIGKLGLGICMDLNFDDFVLYHQWENTTYLLLAVNWLDEGFHVHPYWLHRLYPFSGTTLIANTHGWEERIAFSGNSGVFIGNSCLVAAPKSKDHILCIDV